MEVQPLPPLVMKVLQIMDGKSVLFRFTTTEAANNGCFASVRPGSRLFGMEIGNSLVSPRWKRLPRRAVSAARNNASNEMRSIHRLPVAFDDLPSSKGSVSDPLAPALRNSVRHGACWSEYTDYRGD